MSDQISEKMARKYYSAGTSGEWAELEDEFIENLKRKNLIKPSKLDEARKLLRKICDNNNPDDDYRRGFEDSAERFEAAITEILEERE